MYIRYIACTLALLCGVQQIESNDIDPTTLIATGIATTGCLIGYGIYAYNQHKDQQRVENAVTDFQKTLNEVQERNQHLMNAWQQPYANHLERIQGLGSTSNATFDRKQHTIKDDMFKLHNAYHSAANHNKLSQYPTLQAKLKELEPRYQDTYNNLAAIRQFLSNHKFQLKAHDKLYRVGRLINYYHQPTATQLISQFTDQSIGWPRIKAVTYMQNSIRDLNTITAQLTEERTHHNADAYSYSNHLLHYMGIVRNNLKTACQDLSTSHEYDIERERYRNQQEQEEIKNKYQRTIDAEKERKAEEKRNREATEKQTKALDKHRKEVERAQRLYQELLRRGYHELPYIRKELANAIRELNNIEDRYKKNNQSISLDDIKDIKRRLDTIQSHTPADSHDDLNISFHINVNS